MTSVTYKYVIHYFMIHRRTLKSYRNYKFYDKISNFKGEINPKVEVVLRLKYDDFTYLIYLSRYNEM